MDDSTTSPRGSNPGGLCMCGCGRMTAIAPQTRVARGWVRGEPMRCIRGHSVNKHSPDYAVDPATGCWNWLLSRRRDGYGRGRHRHGERPPEAHVVYYERANGPVPDGLELDHLCRNPACVNPDHLEAVTHVENVRRGANTRLSSDQVAGIRTRYAAGGVSQADLAREYGVSATHVSAIVCGRRWR